MCKESALRIQLNTDQCMHVRKLAKLGERPRKKSRENSAYGSQKAGNSTCFQQLG